MRRRNPFPSSSDSPIRKRSTGSTVPMIETSDLGCLVQVIALGILLILIIRETMR